MTVNYAGTPIDVQKMVSSVWDSYTNARNNKLKQEFAQQQMTLQKQKFEQEQEHDRQSMELYNRVYGNGGGQAASFGGAVNGQYANTGPSPTAFKTDDPIAPNLNAPEMALLNGIAGGESGGKYNIRYTPQGGTTFEGYDRHPNILEPTADGRKSSAAGRYQFTGTTWRDVMGDAPITPENQDIGALKLARRDYSARTGRDLDRDLQAEGFSPRIQQALAPTWAALNSNNERHAATYNQSLERYSRPQVAENEQQAQALDQQMMARDATRQAGLQVAEADLPAPGAQEVQFRPPGGQQTFTDPNIGSTRRLAELRALMAHPRMKDGMRAALKLEHDQIVENTKVSDAVKQYLYAKSEGYKGTLADWKKNGAMNIDARQMGNIPPGYRAQYDQNGNVLSLEPIPGGPAAAKVSAADDKNRMQRDQQVRAGNIVTQDIDRALQLVDSGILPSTGFFGAPLAVVPGTGAHDISSLLETIKANIAFDKLQQMRAASPTGGALGSVSDFENKLLASTMGSLEQSQTPEQFKYNLLRVKNVLNDVIHKGITPESMQQDRKQQGQPVRVQSPDEARRLPSGTPIILPDGTQGRVP